MYSDSRPSGDTFCDEHRNHIRDIAVNAQLSHDMLEQVQRQGAQIDRLLRDGNPDERRRLDDAEATMKTQGEAITKIAASCELACVGLSRHEKEHEERRGAWREFREKGLWPVLVGIGLLLFKVWQH